MESVKKLFGLGQYQVIYVKSNVDNKEYLVRDLPDKQQAADLLAKVRIKLNNLKVHLETKYPDKPQVKQLIRNYRDDPKRFFEATPDAEFTSYSVNKGESIHLCLRQREKNDESLVNEDVMVFVSIHEMGHILTESLGHGPDFWNNFAWILKEAESINIYKHQNFKAHPVKYCGMSITDEPTYDPSKDGTDLSIGNMK
jgi:hypothetical protein